MKRILNYILLPFALIAFNACAQDEKELFNESASVRITNSIEEETRILESATNGWELHYYTGKEYRFSGYTYLLKFKDGKASVAADFVGSDSISTSRYELKRDQGPVLTFTTFNAIMHEKAQVSLENVNGEEGDYEFLILKATADTIHLKGKKWGNHMYLTRLADNVNWKEHLDSIISVSSGVSNNYEISVGESDATGSASLNTLTQHANIKVGNNSYSCAYSTTTTGIELAQPITIEGKEYNSFTLNNKTQNLNNGDVTLKPILPEGYKPISFWIGKWKINHSGKAKAFVTLKQGSGRKVQSTLEYNGKKYPIDYIYDSNKGCLQFIIQHLEVKTTEEPGGALFVPFSETAFNFVIAEGAGGNFIWDETSQTAKYVSKGTGKNKANTFYAVAFNEKNEPIEVDGDFVLTIQLNNITSLTRVNP